MSNINIHLELGFQNLFKSYKAKRLGRIYLRYIMARLSDYFLLNGFQGSDSLSLTDIEQGLMRNALSRRIDLARWIFCAREFESVIRPRAAGKCR